MCWCSGSFLACLDVSLLLCIVGWLFRRFMLLGWFVGEYVACCGLVAIVVVLLALGISLFRRDLWFWVFCLFLVFLGLGVWCFVLNLLICWLVFSVDNFGLVKGVFWLLVSGNFLTSGGFGVWCIVFVGLLLNLLCWCFGNLSFWMLIYCWNCCVSEFCCLVFWCVF